MGDVGAHTRDAEAAGQGGRVNRANCEVYPEKLLRWTDHVEPKRAGGITLLFDAEDKRRP